MSLGGRATASPLSACELSATTPASRNDPAAVRIRRCLPKY
jgi:hypothetical protein